MEAASAEVSGRFHGSFHGRFYLRLWKLSWKRWKNQWKPSISYGIGSFRGCFLWKPPVELRWKLPRSCVHFHGLPCGSTYIHLRPLRPMSFYALALLPLLRASTPSTGFHALPRTSPHLHAIVLSSMTKGKQVEACTEGSKLEASTEGSKLEASTEGSGSSGNFHCGTGSLQ